MLISTMKSRSSLTGLIGSATALVAIATGAVWAQEGEPADPNSRSPSLVIVPLEEDDAEAHFVVGQMAWGDTLGLLNQIQSESDVPPAELTSRLWTARNEAPPLFLFELARLTAETDPAFAVQAYFMGRVRTMYDAARCLDSTALEVINEASAYAGDAILDVMAERPDLTISAIETIISSGSAFTSEASPWWACSFGSSAYFAAVNEDTLSGDQWLMVESRWPSVQSRISTNLQLNLERMRAVGAASSE